MDQIQDVDMRCIVRTLGISVVVSTAALVALMLHGASASGSNAPRVQIFPAADEIGIGMDGTVIPAISLIVDDDEGEGVVPVPTILDTMKADGVRDTVPMTGEAPRQQNAADSTTWDAKREYYGTDVKHALVQRNYNFIFNWVNALLVLCGLMALLISSR